MFSVQDYIEYFNRLEKLYTRLSDETLHIWEKPLRATYDNAKRFVSLVKLDGFKNIRVTPEGEIEFYVSTKSDAQVLVGSLGYTVVNPYSKKTPKKFISSSYDDEKIKEQLKKYFSKFVVV